MYRKYYYKDLRLLSTEDMIVLELHCLVRADIFR